MFLTNHRFGFQYENDGLGANGKIRLRRISHKVGIWQMVDLDFDIKMMGMIRTIDLDFNRKKMNIGQTVDEG